jgi:hypothetical protein
MSLDLVPFRTATRHYIELLGVIRELEAMIPE